MLLWLSPHVRRIRRDVQGRSSVDAYAGQTLPISFVVHIRPQSYEPFTARSRKAFTNTNQEGATRAKTVHHT
jgi:hypothetical protein